jgi:hypothetical protein
MPRQKSRAFFDSIDPFRTCGPKNLMVHSVAVPTPASPYARATRFKGRKRAVRVSSGRCASWLRTIHGCICSALRTKNEGQRQKRHCSDEPDRYHRTQHLYLPIFLLRPLASPRRAGPDACNQGLEREYAGIAGRQKAAHNRYVSALACRPQWKYSTT